MDNLIDVKEQSFSFFGQDSSIEGKLVLAGKIHVCSYINGELIQTDKSPVIIENSGKFNGKLKCHDLLIHGEFSGEVEASGSVKVSSSAIVEGSIKASNLIIEAGADVNLEGHTLQH